MNWREANLDCYADRCLNARKPSRCLRRSRSPSPDSSRRRCRCLIPRCRTANSRPCRARSSRCNPVKRFCIFETLRVAKNSLSTRPLLSVCGVNPHRFGLVLFVLGKETHVHSIITRKEKLPSTFSIYQMKMSKAQEGCWASWEHDHHRKHNFK